MLISHKYEYSSKNTKTFHTCLYFVSTLIHFWKKWLLKSTAIVKSLYCKETLESKVNLLQTWNCLHVRTSQSDPWNWRTENIVFSSQYKTLEKYYNYKYLQMIPDLWGFKLMILNTSMEWKWEEYTAQVPTSSLPRLSSNSELQAAATCSWATAYALRCTVCLSHTVQQGGEFSVFSLYGILCLQDVYYNIIPLSTEAPHIRGILQHSAVLYQHLKMQTH